VGPRPGARGPRARCPRRLPAQLPTAAPTLSSCSIRRDSLRVGSAAALPQIVTTAAAQRYYGSTGRDSEAGTPGRRVLLEHLGDPDGGGSARGPAGRCQRPARNALVTSLESR
jgi:hypothetical protein